MFINKGRTVYKKIILVLFVIFIFVSYNSSFTQQNQSECLMLEHIIRFLERNVAQLEIINNVKRYGVDFELNWKTTAKLVRIGATDNLLEAINDNYRNLLPITTFNNWWPFGGIITSSTDDGSSFLANGNLYGFSGYTTNLPINIGDKKILKVKVEKSASCVFTLDKRMLKVIVGANQMPILCNNLSARSREPEFILQGDGVFDYLIPEKLVSNGELQGLGFVFGPGNINNLKISAWFQ